jgi:hypothetical protein
LYPSIGNHGIGNPYLVLLFWFILKNGCFL